MTDAFPSFAFGFLLSAALIMAIGAQNLFVLRQGLRREHVGAVVLFCGSADALLILAGVAGVGAVLAALPRLTTLLALGGGAFLAWHGIQALRRAAASAAAAAAIAETDRVPLARALMVTAGFTLLNPHVYLDTVLLMGTAGSTQPEAVRPFFVAGAAAASFAWFAALGYGARLLQPLFVRPAAWRVLDGVVAAVMLALAAALVAGTFAAPG